MSVRAQFLAGYRSARDTRLGNRQHRSNDPAQDTRSAFADMANDPAYERLHLLFEACATELADCRRALADLAAEAKRLRANAAAGGDERFRRLALVTQEFLHPDRAGGDERLAAALESIFKELRAEIDKIERGA
jgi:hypothetical protein